MIKLFEHASVFSLVPLDAHTRRNFVWITNLADHYVYQTMSQLYSME